MSSNPGKPLWHYLVRGIIGQSESMARQQAIEASLTRERYTVKQAAAMLGCHEKTLRRWLREGRIKAARPSERKTYIHKNDLVTFLLREAPKNF